MHQPCTTNVSTINAYRLKAKHLLMENKLRIILVAVIVSFYCTFSNADDASVDLKYIPVQLKGSELWSIIDAQNGNIVFKDKFDKCPSSVVNDVFLLENNNGTFDYYNINDINTPLNKTSYYMAADYAPVIPVAERGKTITLINDKFETIATLDDSIIECGTFVNGLAEFTILSGKKGLLNEDGKIVVEARNDEIWRANKDVAICIIKGLVINTDYDYHRNGVDRYYFIDTNGKELYTFDTNKYQSCGLFFKDGLLPVISSNNDVIFIDKTGKKVSKLCTLSKKPHNPFITNYFGYENGVSLFTTDGITFGLKDMDNNIKVQEKYFFPLDVGNGLYIVATFDNWPKFGIIDKEGNVIIDFKYDRLQGVESELYIVAKHIDNKLKFGLIDKNENVIIDFKYDELHTIRHRKDIFLACDQKEYILIDNKGTVLTNYRFTNYQEEEILQVKSNYIDPQKFAKIIISNFTYNTFQEFTDEMTLNDFKEYIDDLNEDPTETDMLTLTREDLSVVFYDDLADKTSVALSVIGFIQLVFHDVLAYKTSEDELTYSLDNKVDGIVMFLDISEFDCVEVEIASAFDKELISLGFKPLKNNVFMSPTGKTISLSYKYGVLTVSYFFKDDPMISFREPRRERERKVPEGMPDKGSNSNKNVDVVYDEDTVVADDKSGN